MISTARLRTLTVLVTSVVLVASTTFTATPGTSQTPGNVKHYCGFITDTQTPTGTVPSNWREMCSPKRQQVAVNDTPNGYHLIKSPGWSHTDYKYQTGVATAYVLDSETGETQARADIQGYEYVNPNNTWNLRFTIFNAFGPKVEWGFDFGCGVNVPGESDPNCFAYPGNGAATTGGSYGVGNWVQPGETFDSDNDDFFQPIVAYGPVSAVKFPYMNLKLQWPDLGNAQSINEFGRWGSYWRGWDTCQTPDPLSTRLCDDSGDGY